MESTLNSHFEKRWENYIWRNGQSQHVDDPKWGGERKGKKNILHTLPLKMQLNGLSLAISAILELRCLGSI